MPRKPHAYTPISRAEPEPTEPTPAELVADGVIGRRDAARLCGHGLSWMDEQIASGRILSFVLDRRRVIPRKALIDFLAAEMVKAAG
ncbi:hypothetical protein [Gemmata sp.]|uniref:hypothetical protein n=1 Tax=Gemmata sp. TaxID=1914242 RepID=UPI003F7267C6